MAVAKIACTACALASLLICVATVSAQELPVEAIEPDTGMWTVTVAEDDGAGAADVTLEVASDQSISYLLGMEGPATLVLNCASNNTSIAFDFGDNFMSDVAEYDAVVIAIDDLAPRTVQLVPSSDKQQLGLYQGASAIPLISSLLNGSVLQMNATPLYGGPFEVTFQISGLREAIVPLRQACRW